MRPPNELLIIQDLQAALRRISVASGYHYNVAQLAVKLDPNQDVDALIAPDGPRPFIIIDVQPDQWVYSPAKLVEVTLPVNIHWVSASVPTDDDSLVTTFFNGCADIEQAIAADLSRGGHAIDTLITQRTSNRAVDSSLVWAVIQTQIRARRIYGQPQGD